MHRYFMKQNYTLEQPLIVPSGALGSLLQGKIIPQLCLYILAKCYVMYYYISTLLLKEHPIYKPTCQEIPLRKMFSYLLKDRCLIAVCALRTPARQDHSRLMMTIETGLKKLL